MGLLHDAIAVFAVCAATIFAIVIVLIGIMWMAEMWEKYRLRNDRYWGIRDEAPDYLEEQGVPDDVFEKYRAKVVKQYKKKGL